MAGGCGIGWVSGLGVLLAPSVGGVEVDEGEGDLLFCSAALGADVVDDVADDAVAHDDLVAAVLEDEAGAVRCASGGWWRIGEGMAGAAGRSGAGNSQEATATGMGIVLREFIDWIAFAEKLDAEAGSEQG